VVKCHLRRLHQLWAVPVDPEASCTRILHPNSNPLRVECLVAIDREADHWAANPILIQPPAECLVANIREVDRSMVNRNPNPLLVECLVAFDQEADRSIPIRIHFPAANLDNRPVVRRPAVNHRVATRPVANLDSRPVVHHPAVSHQAANRPVATQDNCHLVGCPALRRDSCLQVGSLASSTHRASSSHFPARPDMLRYSRLQRERWRSMRTRAAPRRNRLRRSSRGVASAIRR
jgi:hypothetical protein